MWTIIRFQVDKSDIQFRQEGEIIKSYLASCEGCLTVDLVQNTDDQNLWVLISEWKNIYYYRRSISEYKVKKLLTKFFIQAINEPSSYLNPDEL